jgi:hypothetical protein
MNVPTITCQSIIAVDNLNKEAALIGVVASISRTRTLATVLTRTHGEPCVHQLFHDKAWQSTTYCEPVS